MAAITIPVGTYHDTVDRAHANDLELELVLRNFEGAHKKIKLQPRSRSLSLYGRASVRSFHKNIKLQPRSRSLSLYGRASVRSFQNRDVFRDLGLIL
jgi:hypothetical protein